MSDQIRYTPSFRNKHFRLQAYLSHSADKSRSLPALWASRGPMRHPAPLAFSASPREVPTVHWAESSFPAARTVDHSKRPHLISETWRERSFDFCFPLSLYLWQARDLRERLSDAGKFSRTSRTWLAHSHLCTHIPPQRKDKTQCTLPHLMIGRQATGSVRCTSSQHALSPSEQGGHRGWMAKGTLGPVTTMRLR